MTKPTEILCRLCLNEAEEFKLIFNEEDDGAISDIEALLELFQLKVNAGVGKSKYVCLDCLNKLHEFYNFHNQINCNEKYWEEVAEQEVKDDIEVLDETMCEIVPQVKMETKEELSVLEYVEVDAGEQETSLESPPVKQISNKKKKVLKTSEFRSETREKKLTSEEEDKKIRNFYDLACYECVPNPVFSTFLEFKSHKTMVHDEQRPGVVCCNKKLNKRFALLEHITYHCSPDNFKCRECNKLYADKKSLNVHIAQQHGNDKDKPYGCDHCGKRFVKFEVLKMHLRSHLSEEEKKKLRTHLCNECGSTFISQHVLKAHIKYTHLKMGYYCEQCAKHYKAKLDYDIHRRNVHGEEGPARVQCNLCSKWFSHEKALRLHVRDFHERALGPVICPICGIETTTKPALRSHIKMKHTERTHRCEFCHKAFQTSTRLKEHMPVHTGVSLYNCMYCDKSFNGSSNMYKHLKAIHPLEWARDKEDKNVNPAKWRGNSEQI